MEENKDQSDNNKLERAIEKQQALISKQEEEKSIEIQKVSAQEAKDNLSKSVSSIFTYLKELLNLNIGADKNGTITGIKKDIDFKGANVWILIASIFIASIGLNVNSTAVIIGAMLISPLMGPILGMGLALGTYDWETLKRSLRSLGVATFISILTAFIFFSISPLKEITSELQARTSPNLYDAFIAVFGGIAGIIGVSRKEKTNVIPGVAIATALMPPLCTAGYGLAIGNYEYFAGAFFLFFLNSFFICVSTFLIVRLLRIPVKTFLDPKREKTVKRSIAVFSIIVLGSSGYLFFGVAKKSKFEGNARAFVTKVIKYDGVKIANKSFTYNDSVPKIEVILFGDFVPKSKRIEWQKRLSDFDLQDAYLNIIQGKDVQSQVSELAGRLESTKEEVMQEVYKSTVEELDRKKLEIEQLKESLGNIEDTDKKYEEAAAIVMEFYPEITELSFGKLHIHDGTLVTEIPTFIIQVSEFDSGKLLDEKQRITNVLNKELAAKVDVIIQFEKDNEEF